MTRRSGWLAAVALALAWGVLPVLPALLSGLPGHPYTDLYPSVGGLGWFAAHVAEVVPRHAPEIGAPEGIPFVYSSPLHGWLAALTIPMIGLPASYSLGVLAARIATVLSAYALGRAIEAPPRGALLLAAIYGCSPFFHGYTVEGIIEGTDGWALPLWLAAAWRGRVVLATVAAALAVASSWYVAWSGALLAVALLPFKPRATLSFTLGLVVASPLLLLFLGAFPAREPLAPDVRAAMGASFAILAEPGLLPGLHPFAKTSWVGLIAPLLAAVSARRHPWIAAGVLVAALIASGVGPLWQLPLWSAVRFPYRLHAVVLLGLGALAARTMERLPPAAAWLAVAVVVEGLALSPVEPIVPSARADVPAAYRSLAGQVVLSIPGPISRPPGEINPSRQRARYLLYWPAVAGTRVPWIPDFNGVGVAASEAATLADVRTWDRLSDEPPRPLSLGRLAAAGIAAIVLHRDELGASRTASLRDTFVHQGATLADDDGEIVVLLVAGADPRAP